MPEVKIWRFLEIVVRPEAIEALEFAFNELDCLGTEINHVLKKPGDPVKIKGYFDQVPVESDVEGAISEALRIYELPPESVIERGWAELHDADWLAEWKRHWKPTSVGGFVIAPSWETVDEPNRIVIRIEPNMAFGTGTHDTTQLCLGAIERHFTPADDVLDVGTGTGILAIAAAMLRPAAGRPAEGRINAYDTDENSVDLARQNAEINNIVEHIDFHYGPIDIDTPQADLVCANLTLDVILPMLDLLLDKTRRVLILSGILAEQEAEILAGLYKRGFTKPLVEYSSEWISVTVEKA